MKSIKTKLVAYFGIITLLSSLFISLLGFSTNTKDINMIKNQLLKNHVENNMDLAMKYMYSFYGTLRQCNEQLCDEDGNSIEGRTEMVDAILEDLGDKSTIFVKVGNDFKRISTSIISDDNERAVGTFLGTDHNAYESIMKGDLYVGEANILGDNYYTAYQPIKDDNSNIIGILFVGIPTKTLDNIVQVHDAKMDKINMLIIFLRVISLSVLIALASTLLIGKSLTSPIANVADEIERIADYDLSSSHITLQSLSSRNDEIGNTARSLLSLHSNLKDLVEDMSHTSQNLTAYTKELSSAEEQSPDQLKALAKELNEIVERFKI